MSELPDNNRDEARRWMTNVEDDLHSMHAVERDESSPARMTCFLAHLVVEKSLKATLIDAGVPFKKTHNLLVLHDLCVESGRLARVNRELLATCNPWAIDGRYSDDLVEAERDLGGLLARFAEQVAAAARVELEGNVGDD